MRTVAVLVLLLVAVAGVSLSTDQSDVDSQPVARPHTARIPGVAADGGTVVIVPPTPVQPPPDAVWFTVIIKLEVMDAEPEACCLPETQILLVGSDFFTPNTTVATTWTTFNFTAHPMPDLEGCTWTRRLGSGAFDYAIRGYNFWGPDRANDYLVFNAYKPRWSYLISGCRGLRGILGEDETQERRLDEYLAQLFPSHQALGGLTLFTPGNPGQFVQCVTNHAALSGQAQYVKGTLEVYIHTAGCVIPQPTFPF